MALRAHTLIFSRLRILDHRHAGLGLDRAQPQRPVGAGPGENDPDSPLLLVFCQGTKEVIDRQRHSLLRGGLHEMQPAVQDRQIGSARRQIDAIGLHLHPV